MKTPEFPSVQMARVLVVDDEPLLRHGVTLFLQLEGGFTVCGVADSIGLARDQVARHRPELILMELELGNGDTIDLIKAFRSEYLLMPILVYSRFDEALFAERALRAGARGFVMKQEPAAELLAAVRAVLRGKMYLSREMAMLVLKRTFESPAARDYGNAPGVNKLSDRELHIFRLLGSGLGSRRIAENLNLSVKTVEAHRDHIKQKLGLATGAGLNHAAAEWVKEHIFPYPARDRQHPNDMRTLLPPADRGIPQKSGE